MAEYAFGANILENLTTGMYQDSKVIYREYIQNACDQIDKAEELGILRPRDPRSKYPDLGEGKINIWLYPQERRIIIEDNATGIKAEDFQRVLGNIADSDKELSKDKGFRGIGRLCGLAYCQQLIFTSRYDGEDVVSIMTCDALIMRQLINENNTLREFFTRDKSNRGNSYFIGEIFALSRDLIPNSQRSYFNETPVRMDFEHKLKDYFDNELHDMYYDGSDTNASIKKINSYATAEAEFKKKDEEGVFLTADEREREQETLKAKQAEAEKAKKNLEKKKAQGGKSILTQQIIERREREGEILIPLGETTTVATAKVVAPKAVEKIAQEEPQSNPYKRKEALLVDKLFPRASKNEKKLISEIMAKVFIIIQGATDKKTAENIIIRIKENLK